MTARGRIMKPGLLVAAAIAALTSGGAPIVAR